MWKTFFVLLLMLLTACSSATVLSENDSEKFFFVRIGDKQVISLPENPTTGYSWQFFTISDNKDIVSDIKETYIAPDTQMLGAGGVKKYSFTARQKGTLTVIGYYCRPWERPNKENKKVTYTFEIED